MSPIFPGLIAAGYVAELKDGVVLNYVIYSLASREHKSRTQPG